VGTPGARRELEARRKLGPQENRERWARQGHEGSREQRVHRGASMFENFT
jgi:hypothetical protein